MQFTKNDLLKKNCEEKFKVVQDKYFRPSENKQITALCFLVDKIDEKSAFEILTKNGAENISCFMFLCFDCSCKNEKTDDFLNIIREYWGGMLKMGATTFWEVFDIKWIENAARIDEIVPKGKIRRSR